jgi:pimeloyl-ACP methyl ester carboxylesterase
VAKGREMPYITNNGVKIHYEVEGAGPPLVMLHGFLASVADWYDSGYVEQLKDDYQLILIDYRGRGKSDTPHDDAKYSMKLFVDDIVTILNKLAIERCHFYGQSMGGWFIFGLAKYYPEMVQSITVAEAAPGLGFSDWIREILVDFPEFVNSMDDLSIQQKERLLTNDKAALAAMASWGDREAQNMIDLVEEVIQSITVPYLMLMTDWDTEGEQFDLMRKTVTTIPNAEVAEFKELPHIKLSASPDIALPRIKVFLANANKV